MRYKEIFCLLSLICGFVMVKYWWSLDTSSSWPPQVAPGGSASVSQESAERCSALFTVTNTPGEKVLQRYIHYLREAASYNETDWSNKDWTMANFVVQSGQEAEVLGKNTSHMSAAVQEVLLKRSSSTGVSTDDYRKLSRLLPKLISFDRSYKNCDEHTGKESTIEKLNRKNGEEEEDKWQCVVGGSSRLGITKGVLPYVPCLIAPYHHPNTFTACVRKRLDKKKSLWIHFFGDSKIRNIFWVFLNQTDSEYHYMIRHLNQTERWQELRAHLQGDIQYEDMEATSEAEPRMRITFSFRKFKSISRSELEADAEMIQLRRWATGDEAPPDLLLVGYTTWLLQRTVNLNNHHALGFLLALQQVVVPLLEQISQKSRVLVLPQSRLRRHGHFGMHNMLTTFSNGNFDWTEMMFLYHLRRYRGNHNSPQAQRKLIQLPSTSSQVQETKSQVTDTGQARSGHLLDDTGQGGKSGEEPYRDHLVPEGAGGGGVWWWDTSLPLNLAEISECEEMYQRGWETHPLYHSDLLRCGDAHHAGSATQKDLITMIFNLMCNSVLGLHHSVCCS